jgi:hypothetical protein
VAFAFPCASFSWSNDGPSFALISAAYLLAASIVGVDPFSVFVLVCERRVHVGEGELGVFRDDFVRTHAHPLVPDRDILDLNAVPVNTWPSAAYARRAHDPGAGGRSTVAPPGDCVCTLDVL